MTLKSKHEAYLHFQVEGKQGMDDSSFSQNVPKEVKGVVEHDDNNGSNRENKRNEQKKDMGNTGIETEEGNQKPKGLPHQQVPQPADFPSDALDKELPPTQA